MDWDGPADSRWTYYLVKHRDILRNSQSSWVINSTYSPNLTMPDRFPGEKYEIQVFAVSESVRSDVQMIHIIVGKFWKICYSYLQPPLPPPPLLLQTKFLVFKNHPVCWSVSYCLFVYKSCKHSTSLTNEKNTDETWQIYAIYHLRMCMKDNNRSRKYFKGDDWYWGIWYTLGIWHTVLSLI